MRPTHILYAYEDHISVLGMGRHFSWIIQIEYNEFVLSTIYGQYRNTYPTLRKTLDAIGYKK